MLDVTVAGGLAAAEYQYDQIFLFAVSRLVNTDTVDN